jgi:DNA polymerase I-like protein with 3'-5' exonuclease and polymerase domains
MGVYESVTGRVYKFFEYDSTFKKDASFSPTEMKNYPVQGFATADIMALYRGRVYRRLLREDTVNIKLINTVHDSVMLDVRGEGLVRYVYGVLKEEAERLPELLKDLWGIDTKDIPFKVEGKYGQSWGGMKKIGPV